MNVINRRNAPDVHDLEDEHQSMKTGTERTDVDDLVQCVHVAQHSLPVSCQTAEIYVYNSYHEQSLIKGSHCID